ncbi:MAG TPA: hypothetical protein VL978_03250 [Puia sp.]|nr:hypothetical protein [Puia sp.]
MPVTIPFRRTVAIVFIAQIIFSNSDKTDPPAKESFLLPQWAGMGNIPGPDKLYTMRQADTTGLDYLEIRSRYRYFTFDYKGRDSILYHATHLDIDVTVHTKGFKYKWVQMVAKPVSQDQEGKMVFDTLCDGTPGRHHIGTLNYPFYYKEGEGRSHGRPPEIQFTDQPQTAQSSFDWTAQASLFAFKRRGHHYIWLGTFEWGYKVRGDSTADTISVIRNPRVLWPKSKHIIDSLTHQKNGS